MRERPKFKKHPRCLTRTNSLTVPFETLLFFLADIFPTSSEFSANWFHPIFTMFSMIFSQFSHDFPPFSPPFPRAATDPPGELGAERLMELLAASFDWDASLRDPKAALAYLGRRPEEKLDYEERLWGPSGASGGWGGSGMGFRDGVGEGFRI